jgi:hypothetical protein
MHCRDHPTRYTSDLAPVYAVARAVLRLNPSSMGKLGPIRKSRPHRAP